MAVAAVVVVGRRRREEADRPQFNSLSKADMQRIKAEIQAEQERKKFKNLLVKHDTDKTGKLNKEQMMKLLTELDTTTPPGTPPSEEELNFIISTADAQGTWAGFADGQIDSDEIEAAIVAWRTYLDHRQLMDEAMKRFDATQNGQLNKEELKGYLKELNQGEDPTDAEVDWVLRMADLSKTGELNKPELLRATLEWFSYVERKKQDQSCCNIL
mmetsp:Transcript_88083/g.139163  ORF Transcript_88083/g.139163 Transcript_88083/m.139163 type:complete len:214 (-) Transcript_88083:82-723(-)